MNFKYKEFSYWFFHQSLNKYSVREQSSGRFLATVDNDKVLMYDKNEDSLIFKIHDQFMMYKQRPEYVVGQLTQVNGASFDLCKSEYINLITGILLIRALEAGKDPDDHIDYVNKILNWLESTDFYDAPASTIYHENFPHGLLYHTLTVYNNMCELHDLPKFNNSNIAGASLCSLTHDWCKIGLYENYKKNVKNEVTGQWEKQEAYRRGTFAYPFGHGAASMYMVMKSIRLSEEEALAIRWHMSRWNVSENEQNEYQQACEDYPLVHLIQFADQLAITNY